MKRLLLVVLAALTLAAPAFAQFATPEALVRQLYAYYGVGQNDKNDFPSDRSVAQRFFDTSLWSAWDRASRPPETTLDYDYFIQGQDFSLTPAQIARQSAAGDKAVVRAQFKNFDKPVVIDYELIHTADGWRIYDARAKGDKPLRQVLKIGR